MPDRTRPGLPATTGQLPAARTRATSAGPHGTAPIPVVRVAPPAPRQDPRPTDPARGQQAAPAPVDPPRRRLRVEPPAAPADRTAPLRRPVQQPLPTPRPTDAPPAAQRLAAAPRPTAAPAPLAAPQRAAAPSAPPRTGLVAPLAAPRSATVAPPTAGPRTAPAPAALHAAPAAPAAPQRSPRPAPGPRPDSRVQPAPRPVVRRTPPPPAPPAAEPATDRRRRPVRVALALLAVAGLVAISALPSIGAETAGAPPVAGVHLDDDLQQFHVSDDVDAPSAQTDAMSGSVPVVVPSWVVPLRGELRDGFGPRLAQPVAGVSLFHRGQDIGGGCGAPIHAAAAGTVVTSRWWGTYGNWTLIDHGDGVETGYAHQARMVVSVGQHVKVGQVIGYEGNTGASTGCHLHLEVHLNGVAVNPVPFFQAKGIPLGR